MDRSSALTRLYGLTPKGVTLGLDRVERAAALLGNPERDLYAVQVGGTNGKGTVSAVLAHASARSNLCTGLFTSPHLHRFSERIRIDGKEVSAEQLEIHLNRVLRLNDEVPELSLSFFEVATLAALCIFCEEKTDVCVMEVGLGGRLDATCAARPRLTAVTSVALDHTALLGDTVEAIAAEKAGIARPGVPLVAGAMEDKAYAVLKAHCEQIGAPLLLPNRDYPSVNLDELHLPWPGRHHAGNIAVAAELFRRVRTHFPSIREAAFFEALPSVSWPGRFEIIEANRRYILDCAHNMEAAQALAQTFDDTGEHPSVLLYGALRDKPAAEMLSLYRRRVSRVVLTAPPISRAADPRDLAAPEDVVAEKPADALEAAVRLAGPSETILVTGSLFTVAEIRRILLNEPSDPPVGL